MHSFCTQYTAFDVLEKSLNGFESVQISHSINLREINFFEGSYILCRISLTSVFE